MVTNNTFTLLITACISPNTADFSFNKNFRIDPKTRLDDYTKSFIFWLNYNESQIKNIVFIENSGYDIEPLKKIAQSYNRYNRKIEFIQIMSTSIPKGIHYGFAELEMIDEVIYRSTLIHDTPYFIKVTGRIYFPRLSKLIHSMNNYIIFLSDSRDYVFGNIEKRYIVTTLLIIKLDFFKRKLHGVKHYMYDGFSTHFETLYFQILKPLSLNDKRIVLRFPFNVDPVGYGAHWNVNYNSVSKKFESMLRGFLRIFLPAFKI